MVRAGIDRGRRLAGAWLKIAANARSYKSAFRSSEARYDSKVVAGFDFRQAQQVDLVKPFTSEPAAVRRPLARR